MYFWCKENTSGKYVNVEVFEWQITKMSEIAESWNS